MAWKYDILDPQLYYDPGHEPSLFDPTTSLIVHRLPFPETSRGPEAEAFHKTNIHEITHWLQHSSTSWGIFSSFCNLAQSQRLARWLGEVGEEGRDEFFSNHENSVTLFAIKSDANLACNLPELANRETSYLGEVIACYYGLQLLFNTQRLAPMGVRPRVLAQALEVCLRFPWGDAQPEYQPQEPDQRLGDDTPYSALDVGLSTVDILESAAVVNETMAIGQATDNFDSKELEDTVRTSVRRLLGFDTPWYSRCFRIWVGKHPDLVQIATDASSVENLGKALFTFSLLADAALNPPLPPFYKIENTLDVLWKDVHPPARFSLLVDAASKMPLIDNSATDEQANNWALEALAMARLPSVHEDIAKLTSKEANFNYEFPDDFCYAEAVLLPRFKRLLNLRKGNLLTVASPGEIVHRPKSKDASVQKAFDESFWLPVFLNSDYKVHSFMPQEAAARYCESAFLRRCMRFSVFQSMDVIVSKPHHKALAKMRPEEGFEALTMRNLVTQYGAWT